MQFQGAVNQIINGITTFRGWASAIVLALILTVGVISAVHFLRKDQRGDEEGKASLMKVFKALGVLAAIVGVGGAAFTWIQSMFGG